MWIPVVDGTSGGWRNVRKGRDDANCELKKGRCRLCSNVHTRGRGQPDWSEPRCILQEVNQIGVNRVHTTRYQPDFNETRCILEEINRMAEPRGENTGIEEEKTQ
jgi:hypothetical protein